MVTDEASSSDLPEVSYLVLELQRVVVLIEGPASWKAVLIKILDLKHHLAGLSGRLVVRSMLNVMSGSLRAKGKSLLLVQSKPLLLECFWSRRCPVGI